MSRKHLIFDMDGTIVHSHDLYNNIVETFSNQMGLPFDIMKLVQGYTNPLINDLGWGLPLEQQPAMYEKMRHYHLKEMQENKNFIPAIYPGLEKIIPELAEEYDLSLITVNSRIIANEILEQHNLNQYFPAKRTLCCAQERNYNTKPSADALFCLLEEIKQHAKNSIMIGDSADDINMAHAAGIPGIAVLWGLSSTEKVLAANPTVALKTPAELPQAIKDIFSRQ